MWERSPKTRPILNAFPQNLGKRSTKTPPKGLLGKAISYALNQWDRLLVYLDEPVAMPDNNLAENGIRPLVLGRKNGLSAGTPGGAEASALLYSLIETARANSCEPYNSLRHVFAHLPGARSLADCEALLPWNLDRPRIMLATVKGRSIRRLRRTALLQPQSRWMNAGRKISQGNSSSHFQSSSRIGFGVVK